MEKIYIFRTESITLIFETIEYVNKRFEIFKAKYPKALNNEYFLETEIEYDYDDATPVLTFSCKTIETDEEFNNRMKRCLLKFSYKKN